MGNIFANNHHFNTVSGLGFPILKPSGAGATTMTIFVGKPYILISKS